MADVPLIDPEDSNLRVGFRTRYSKSVIRPDYFASIRIRDLIGGDRVASLAWELPDSLSTVLFSYSPLGFTYRAIEGGSPELTMAEFEELAFLQGDLPLTRQGRERLEILLGRAVERARLPIWKYPVEASGPPKVLLGLDAGYVFAPYVSETRGEFSDDTPEE